MNPFEQIQADVYARLLADGELADVPIVMVRPRSAEDAVEITGKIDEALAGLVGGDRRAGATIIVQMPEGRVPEPEVPGPRMDVQVTALVLENPLINMGADGTRLSAEEIGMRIINRLHHTFWQDFGSTMVADREALEPYSDDAGRLGYNARLTMPLGLTRPPKATLVQITGTAAAVTLQTGTAGAQIWFTTDGSYPSGNSPTAQVYAAPFAVEAGTTVRAVANKAGLVSSDIAAKTL